MNIIQRLLYRLKLFLKIEKRYVQQKSFFYQVTAMNEKLPEEKYRQATIKLDSGREMVIRHTEGAIGYIVNGQKAEILSID